MHALHTAQHLTVEYIQLGSYAQLDSSCHAVSTHYTLVIGKGRAGMGKPLTAAVELELHKTHVYR